MTVKITIDTSEHGGAQMTDERSARVRAAVGDPAASITVRHGKLPGRTTINCVQTMADVLAAYGIPPGQP